MGKKKKPFDVTKLKKPSDVVKKLMKAGKIKKKCCRSSSRCKRCPVLALQKAKADYKKAA